MRGFITESRLCGALLLAVLLATVLSYRAGMTGGFSADDYVFLRANLRFADAWQALSVFGEHDNVQKIAYRPLVRLSLWLNWQLSQDATAFHWTNLLLHLGNTAALFLLLRLLFDRPAPALVGATAFALHPIHSTNVLWVMGRTDLLFSLFYLAALLLFLLHWRRSGARTILVLSLLLFVLALASKEMAISLPVLLLAMTTVLGEGTARARAASALRSTLPYFLVLLCYVGLRVLFVLRDGWETTPSEYLNFAASAILFKAGAWSLSLAYPFDLYRMRHLLESEPQRFLVTASVVCTLAVVAMHLALWRRWRSFYGDRLFWLGAAWIPITLLPILGGSPNRWYLYLPSAGFCMVLAATWNSLRARHLCSAALIIGLLFYASELVKQSRTWSRQSELSEKLLQQVHDLGMRSSETHWFANVPFGYKSAFLFPGHLSFAAAIELRFGLQPDIRILSYVNLRDELRIESARIGSDWLFRLEPDAHAFVVLPGYRRRFAASTTQWIQGAEVEIKALSQANTATEYWVRLPSPSFGRFHYFDGQQLQTDLNAPP